MYRSCQAADILLAISVIGFPICLFAELIILGKWHSRISPYFKNGEDLGLDVYKTVSYNFYMTLALFIIISLFFVVFLVFSGCNILVAMAGLGIGMFAGFGVFFVINLFLDEYLIVDLIRVSSAALKNDGGQGKCHKYLIDGIHGADKFYGNGTKYRKWRSNFINEAFDNQNKPTKYVCQSVAVPAIIFAVIMLICILCFLIHYFFGCNSSFGCLNDLGDLAVRLL